MSGVRPDTWQAQLLNAIGAPVTAVNATFLSLWAQAEGGSARNNPLNTTQPASGATNYNSVGVKNYPDQATGVAALATTLKNGRYSGVLSALQRQDSTAAARAVVASPWGTGPQLLALVGDSQGNAVPQGITGGAATGVVQTATSGVKTIGDLVGALGSSHTWFRVVEVIGGLGAIVFGVVLLNKGSVIGATKAVGKAVPGAAASAVVTKGAGAVAGAV